MKHWAANFIGKPWRSDGFGPDAYNCRELVRCAYRLRHSVELPLAMSAEPVPANSPEVRAAQSAGWQRVTGAPREDDIVLMHGPTGYHIGLMVEADGKLGVLHADGCDTKDGPRGSVVWQPLADATSNGYHRKEVWRLV